MKSEVDECMNRLIEAVIKQPAAGKEHAQTREEVAYTARMGGKQAQKADGARSNVGHMLGDHAAHGMAHQLVGLKPTGRKSGFAAMTWSRTAHAP